MKKIITIMLVFVLSITLISCKTDNINEKMKEFLNENVPKTISSDVILPTSFLEEEITWYLEGEELQNNVLSVSNNSGTKMLEMKLSYKGKAYSSDTTIKFIQENFISKMYVYTENKQEVTSKENYIDGTVSLEASREFSFEDEKMEIRGRGNSTWGNPKKPYRIKFNDRISILGMKKAKNYVLLAEYGDKSLMRNFFAHNMSADLDISYTLETRYLEVYMNDEYIGVYLLTEHVQVDKNRMNIDESGDRDGGFLIEMEAERDRATAEGTENVHWFELEGFYYVIKSPDVDDLDATAVTEVVNYIKQYLIDMNKAITSNSYQNYIDVDKWIDYFIIQEITKNVDVAYSSVYLHKDKDKLLNVGPIWDFDISMGNGDYASLDGYEMADYRGFWALKNNWLTALLKQNPFKTNYINRFKLVLNEYFDEWLKTLDQTYNNLSDAANRNFERFLILGEYVWPNPTEMVEADTYQKQYEYLRTWLVNRKAWLLNNLDSLK